MILTTASILHNSQEASNETKMDSHLSSKDNEDMWMNMSPTVKSRGRELGVRVSVGTAHNCCPSPSEVEAGRGSGAHSELEASLDYMRLCLRGKRVLSSLLLRGAALGPLWSSSRERESRVLLQQWPRFGSLCTGSISLPWLPSFSLQTHSHISPVYASLPCPLRLPHWLPVSFHTEP